MGTSVAGWQGLRFGPLKPCPATRAGVCGPPDEAPFVAKQQEFGVPAELGDGSYDLVLGPISPVLGKGQQGLPRTEVGRIEVGGRSL